MKAHKSKSIEELSLEIDEFNKARGWTPEPADLAKSVIIEAAELLEHFQWDKTDSNLEEIQSKNWVEVGEEIADVFWYLQMLCQVANLNLAEVVQDKITKNESKYPEDKFKGKHNDEFYKRRKKQFRSSK